MAQKHDEHLTTEQLSAFVDKQLSPDEQAVFDAHLSTCPQCQRKLADLRLTVGLLRALPQEEVPRSFVLPAPVQERPARRAAVVTPVARQRRVWPNALQRTVRTVSTLAAVLALIFIISGVVQPLHFGGGASFSTASENAPAIPNKEASGASKGPITPRVSGTAVPGQDEQAKTPQPAQTPGPTPTPTPRPSIVSGAGPPADQTPALPPFLDLGQPQGRLTIGALLLVLSIIGLVITRRRRGPVY